MGLQTIKRVFKILGYSEKQAQIYECLLQYPSIGLIDIARITKIPRTTLYDYYPKMLADGVISESSDQGKRIFTANDPQILLDRLELVKLDVSKSTNAYKKVLVKYKTKYNNSEIFPKISYYSEESGVKKVMRKILSYDENYNTCFSKTDGDIDSSCIVLNHWFIKEMQKRNICSKELLYEDKENVEYVLKYISKNQKCRFVDSKICNNPEHVDKYIFGDYVALINYTKLTVVLIKDKAFAQNERVQFDLFWEKL